MPVSKAEQRIPSGFVVADLGQVVAASGNRAYLISYYASPVARGHKQSYVALVTDGGLQSSVDSYQWQVLSEDVSTTDGVWEYTPEVVGSFTLNLTLKDGGGATLETLSLEQRVISPNEDLENLVAQSNTTHPVAGDPVASREVINDYLAHIHAVAPVSSAELLNRLLFGISYVESQANDQEARDTLISSLRTALEGGDSQAQSFFDQAAPGAGICGLRPELLAMSLEHGGSPIITWTDLPSEVDEREPALVPIRESLAGLAEDRRIDLFNVLRFPRASLKACKLVFDALRTRYFSGHSLDSITGSRPEILALIDQYNTGPYLVSTGSP